MNDLTTRIAVAQSAMPTPWDSKRASRVFGAAVKAREARGRRHRVTMVLGAAASAALVVFVLHTAHHGHFSSLQAGGGSFDRGSEPSLSAPDDLASAQGPLSLNAVADGGSEAD
ncbi:MAG: hypothetical protein ABI551_19820 [Polyangiaceae bacterium]